MRITICLVGKLRRGPNKDLFDDYAKLIAGRGPQANFSEFSYLDVDNRKAPPGEEGRNWEAERLLARVPEGALVVALDENGQSYSSERFAQQLKSWRDDGVRDVAFLIGGAYGHGQSVLDRATLKLALGPATWPHQLVPILVAEQIYRTACILTGHPYHHG